MQSAWLWTTPTLISFSVAFVVFVVSVYSSSLCVVVACLFVAIYHIAWRSFSSSFFFCFSPLFSLFSSLSFIRSLSLTLHFSFRFWLCFTFFHSLLSVLSMYYTITTTIKLLCICFMPCIAYGFGKLCFCSFLFSSFFSSSPFVRCRLYFKGFFFLVFDFVSFFLL